MSKYSLLQYLKNFRIFLTSIVAKHQKKSEKVSMPKKLKGDPLVSPGIVCYAEKEEKPFWFSSLGQMIQFGTMKFCRSFKV